MNHQARQGAEHLAEALDPEPSLGDHDEIVKDPSRVVSPGHSDTESEVSGPLGARVTNDEGADRRVSQEPDSQVPAQVGLIPAGLLRQIVHEGEVDDSGLLTGGTVGGGTAASGFLDV